MAKNSELLQGTLDLLILKALALGSNHGLGVSRRIAQITQGTFDVKPGSLFPALHRLEEKGWLVAEWGQSENNRRAKYYRLTQAGRRRLDTEVNAWRRTSGAITRAIEATS
ncbi:MAG: PadR family transcriptional regulator [Bryobacteraceae bacterium]|nr:PadR family transcriptional regulator [Bryobacteraceae bacterium]HEU0143063.1 PadR family transcriptional regulator [Bryobacteraceae bacterium]